MASNMYLQILLSGKPIPGDSDKTVDGNKANTLLDIEEWAWDLTQQSAQASEGKLLSAGRPVVGTIRLTRYMDGSSPLLLQRACENKTLDEAKIIGARTVTPAGSTTPMDKTSFRILMAPAFIVGISFGQPDAEGRIKETVSLSFLQVKVEYFPLKGDGTASAPPLATALNLRTGEFAYNPSLKSTI